MKTHPRQSRHSWILVLLAFTWPAKPQEPREAGPYFNFEGGPNWVQSVDARVEGFPGKAELDVGGRIGLSFGYNFNRNLGIEFDTGWLWNEFEDSDLSLTQIPLLANGIFRYPNYTHFEPYIGVGVGGVSSLFGFNDCCGDYDTDFAFAWQGMAGVRYNFTPNMAVGLGYKYLGMMETDFNLFGVRTQFDTLHNHSFGVVFRMSF